MELMKKKKIILFSPNGYVGSFIKKELEREKNAQLFTMTRDSYPEQFPLHCDILIYSAAITSARYETSEKYVQDNVVTAVSIVNFCKSHNISRIIYLSTDEIYGELNVNKVTDRAVMVNPNLYAITKYLAEKIIMQSGISYYILRLPGIVGQVWGNNFIHRLMDKIKNNDQIELYNMDREFNNIIHIEDLTKFIIKLCNREDMKENEVFLLGNTENVLLRDVVVYMKKLYCSTCVINNIDTNLKRYFTLDVTKAVEYGYSSKNIKIIIKELYSIQKGVNFEYE